jgi:tRNA modification GTPase
LKSQIGQREFNNDDRNYSLHFLEALNSQGIKANVLALNKCDLLDEGGMTAALALLGVEFNGPVVPISALRGDGIDRLRGVLGVALQSAHTTVMSDSIALNDRQRTSVAAALNSMTRAADLVQQSESTSQCADLLAFELREALDALGEVTGEVTTEDLLSEIFANFCIGK